MYFVGASADEKERYARWVKLELEKENNDIDEIMNLARELQDIRHTTSSTGGKALPDISIVLVILAPAKTSAECLARINKAVNELTVRL